MAAVPNSEYSFASPRPQRFSFPYDMIEKMTKNPTCCSNGYMKLLKTCKWFFANGKILPIPFITLSADNLWIPPTRNIDITTCVYKLWITKKIIINYFVLEDFFKFFKSKIHRCDDASLKLSMKISTNGLKNLFSSFIFKEIYFVTGFTNLNNHIGPDIIYNILEILPANSSLSCIREEKEKERQTAFGGNYCYRIIIKQEFKKINFVNWFFNKLSNEFDLQKVYDIAKVRKNDQTVNLHFTFSQNINSDCKEKLNSFVDNVIKECEVEALRIFPPMMSFPGSNKNAMKELEILRDNYRKQISRQTSIKSFK